MIFFFDFKKFQKRLWKYGWALKVELPVDEYDSDGWTVVIRYKSTVRGSFQVWNANFFGFYENSPGVYDVMIQQKFWTKTDLAGENSFVLLGDHLEHGEIRKKKNINILKEEMSKRPFELVWSFI